MEKHSEYVNIGDRHIRNIKVIWDLETGKLLLTLNGHTQAVISLAFTSDGDRLISGSWDNTIRIWDLKRGTLLKTINSQSGGVCDIIMMPDGKQFVTGLEDGTIKFWNLDCVK